MRRAVACILSAGLLMGLSVGCQPSDDRMEIAVIPKGTTHEFWKSIHAGAVKAERELNEGGHSVEILWRGPLQEDDRDSQIQVVENFTTRGVAGMVLAPLDSQALVRPVETAMSAEIPVVIMDSGLDTDRIVSFVATDNYEGGRLGGEHLAELLGGEGDILLLRYAVGSASTEQREAGFLDVIEEDYPDLNILSADQYGGPTRESAYRAAESLLNRFGDEVDGVFCPCEPITIGMTKALRDIGRAGGEVQVVGFDAGSRSVEDLERGDVQALVVQDPLTMGYLGVQTVFQAIQGEEVDKRIDTGVTLVTRDNMEEPEAQRLLHPPLEDYL